MATPTASPIPKSEAIFPLERVAKISTLAIPLIYVLGFIVVNIHQADFGITDFSLIRVKALAAGLVFALFLAIPALLALRSFRLFGMRSPGGTRVDFRGDSQRIYLYVIKLLDLYPICVFLSLVLASLFVSHPRSWVVPSPAYQPGLWLDVATGVVSFSAFALMFVQHSPIAKHLANRPIRCTVLAFLTWVLWVVWTVRMSDWLFFQLTMWLYVVTLGSILAAEVLKKGIGFTSLDWEMLTFVALSFLLPWFGGTMYGNIKPAFGGGHPIAARFYLQQENPVWGSKIIETSIIEETEQGYYVTKLSEKKKAVFIPRSLVTSVQLGGTAN